MTWTDRWAATSDRLAAIETTIRAQGAAVQRSGTFDHWDLEIGQGSLGTIRLLMSVEENPGRTQVVRIRWWPRLSPLAGLAALLLAGPAGAAAVDGADAAAIILAVSCLIVVAHTIRQCATAAGVTMQALRQQAMVTTALPAASYDVI